MITALAARSIAAVLVVAGAAGLTWVLTAPEPVRSEEQPARAWIDRPLQGSVLPLGRVEVVAHAADADGVVTVRLEVDGAPQARAETGPGALVDATWTWEPSVPGTYELTVVGEDPSGEVGQPAVVVVTIVDDEPAPTVPPSAPPSPTASPSPPASPSPATTPGPTPLPVPSSPSPQPSPTPPPASTPPASPTTAPTSPRPPSPTSSPSPPPPACQPGQPTAVEEYPQGWFFTYEWSYTGCTPAEFQVQVSQTQTFVTVDRTGVVAGDQRSWQDGDVGWYQDCVTYDWRVRAVDGDVTGPWSNVRSFAILECPH